MITMPLDAPQGDRDARPADVRRQGPRPLRPLRRVAQRLGVYTVHDYAGDRRPPRQDLGDRRPVGVGQGGPAQDYLCRHAERYEIFAQEIADKVAERPRVPFCGCKGPTSDSALIPSQGRTAGTMQGVGLIGPAHASTSADHLPVHVGQPALDAVVVVGQPLVVQAQQVQDRGVEVVDGRRRSRPPCSRTRRSPRS